MDCVTGKTHIYVLNEDYSADFLDDEDQSSNEYGKYLGTLKVGKKSVRAASSF
jgi:hypothetical protein